MTQILINIQNQEPEFSKDLILGESARGRNRVHESGPSRIGTKNSLGRDHPDAQFPSQCI